jgi:hypothetical protein
VSFSEVYAVGAIATLVALRVRHGPRHVLWQYVLAVAWPWPVAVWLAEAIDGGGE